MKKIKVAKKPYEDECGDGCCTLSGTEWFVDGKSVARTPCDDDAWVTILREIGIEVTLVGLDEDGEEVWEL